MNIQDDNDDGCVEYFVGNCALNLIRRVRSRFWVYVLTMDVARTWAKQGETFVTNEVYCTSFINKIADSLCDSTPHSNQH